MKKFIKDHIYAISTVITALASVALTFFSQTIYEKIVSNVFQQNVTSAAKVVILVAVIIVSIFILAVVAFVSEKVKSCLLPDIISDKYMRIAFLYIRELNTDKQRSFQESNVMFADHSISDLLVHEFLENMQLTVQSCYRFFDNSFSSRNELVNNIKFEVTFMTKSYLDGEITIPCSANKESRTPASMLMRKSNSKIYNGTETDKIYKRSSTTRPVMVLIENTTDTRSNYVATYSNQTERIKSSVILPVLSHKNELLGTLVVHCDKVGFFKNSQYKLWNELLELFSAEIGYYKLLLDYYISNHPEIAKPF